MSGCVEFRALAMPGSREAAALLLSDENAPEGALKDELVAERTGMSVNTLARIRRRCCELGLVQALERKTRLIPNLEKI